MTQVAVRLTGRGAYSVVMVGANGVRHTIEGTAPTREDWIASRVAMAATECARRGWSEEQAAQAAIAAVSVWALETGWGAAEWNGNPGNVHCTSDTQTCARLSNGENIIAYPNIGEGIVDWFALVERRYPLAMARLHSGELTLLAWNTLRRGGYGGSSVTGADAISIFNRVARGVSAAELTADERADILAEWTPAAELPGASTGGGSSASTGGRDTTTVRNVSGAAAGGGSSAGGGGLLLAAALLGWAAWKGR